MSSISAFSNETSRWGEESLKEPSEKIEQAYPPLYALFKAKCMQTISNAIYQKKTHTEIYLRWLIEGNEIGRLVASSYFTYEMKHITKVYNELKDHFWNKDFIDISMGGIDGGSGVDIIYTDHLKDRAEHVKENQAEYDAILAIAQRQLSQLKQGESARLDLRGICMVGLSWPYVMREVSEKLGDGKIIKIDGQLAVKKIDPAPKTWWSIFF